MPRPRTEQPKFSLARRGNRYYVQWWESGAAHRVSCRTEKPAEARRFLAEFKAGRETEQPPPAPTIGQILSGYIADRIDKVHSDTIRYECATLNRYFADLPVDMLADAQVRGYTRSRRNDGAGGASALYRNKVRPLSNGTLIRELGTLRAALAWAVKKKWITSAPYIQRPEAPPARDRWLTRLEATKLLNAAHAPHIRLFIAVAVYTGARTGAVLDLTWDRVSLERSLIELGRGRGRKRRAIVPIVDVLRDELANAVEGATSLYVIEYGGDRVQSIKTGFRNAVRRAGLYNVTPHVLRHTAATWMVQRGVPFEMVAKYLGNTKDMVEKVYGHHSPEWLRQAADALSMPMAEKTQIARSDKSVQIHGAAGQD